MIVEKLKKYNKYKFKIEPSNKVTATYPILLSPLISFLFLSFIICFVVSYLIITNPMFSEVSSSTKGRAAIEVISLISSSILFFSYMYTLLVVYPISLILRHKNGKLFDFLIITFSLSLFAISYYLSIEFNHVSPTDLNMYTIIGPILILFITMINGYSFKSMNELIKRDEKGKIVYKKKIYEHEIYKEEKEEK